MTANQHSKAFNTESGPGRPPKSSLVHNPNGVTKLKRRVMYTREEAEVDTITEGIGIKRLTKNFMMEDLDGAYRGTDMEAVEMSRYLLRKDGLFVGSSSAMNCVGVARLAKSLGPDHTIVTILCDRGMRHLRKFYDHEYLSSHGWTPFATGLKFLDV